MKQGKANILLVADKNQQMNLLSEALISIGHSVKMVNTGSEALGYLDRQTVDLVIADISLRELSDADFHEIMKRDHADLPLILITGPAEQNLTQTNQPGVVIAKPFRIGQIEDLIHVLLKDNAVHGRELSGRMVLVVDDDDAFRTMLIRSLQVSGYAALGATDGQMALELLERGGIGTVIADINMPYMDGVTLMKKVKHLWPHIPVVLITGYYSNEENPAGGGIRPDGFLMKPFKIQSIEKLLRDLAERSPSG